MRWFLSVFFTCICIVALCSDSVYAPEPLKGYCKLFYKIITTHPQLNSPIEKKLLQHYLSGSGAVYLLSDSEFERLKKAVVQYKDHQHLSTKELSTSYFTEKVTLDNDAYFGFALGTITCIYESSSGNMISFIDKYDFNNKKKGIRHLKSELYTRIFRLIAPRKAKAFTVCYVPPAPVS
jgi:hypothetical protein